MLNRRLGRATVRQEGLDCEALLLLEFLINRLERLWSHIIFLYWFFGLVNIWKLAALSRSSLLKYGMRMVISLLVPSSHIDWRLITLLFASIGIFIIKYLNMFALLVLKWMILSVFKGALLWRPKWVTSKASSYNVSITTWRETDRLRGILRHFGIWLVI